MKIMKRNGTEVDYDGSKIIGAVRKANKSVTIIGKRLSEAEITVIEERISREVNNAAHILSVEDIQNAVIREIYAMGKDMVGYNYAVYRYKHEQMRKNNPLYENCVTLLDDKNEDAKGENANKKTVLLSTQRDYMAGYMNKELNRRYYINDDEIQDYHDSGRGHHHDQDYTAQRMTNCGLINLDDCLQNGTVISGKTIYKPKSFRSATNVGSQVVGMVASFQFGGQTFNLAHFLPFVETSRRKIRARVIRQQEKIFGIIPDNAEDIYDDTDEAVISQHPLLDKINAQVTITRAKTMTECSEWDIPKDQFYKAHTEILDHIGKSEIDAIIENELQSEIADGVQTIQYQLVTYMTTNGQSPFVSMYINLDDAKTEQEKKDYCMIIREVFLQRIIGIPDANGVFVPTAFPKILYVVDEDNKPGMSFAENDNKLKSKFWEITYMAAVCSSKVMTPDYISAKKMREFKDGDVYPCMGCRSFLTVDRFTKKYGNIANALNYKPGEHKYFGRFNMGRQICPLSA